jgi:pimeloyl-ACP methyl ester carboxylesterase
MTTAATSSVNGTAFKRDVAHLERRSDGFFHRSLDVGEVTLHVAEARPVGVGTGDVPKSVPLVVFLHGFPEFWWSWREQLTAVAAAGMWAVAPDMRGYNESDKPEGVASYEVEKLAADVAGLIRALGREKAIVVGHDWGGAVAWMFAQEHPELLERLAILNVPHPLAFMKGIRQPKQLKKSWYMFFFQLPRIPERVIAKNDYAFVRHTFRSDGVDRETIEHFVDAIRVPGAVTGAINYYRAAMRRILTGRVPESKPIESPVLVGWGDADRYLGREMAEPPKRFVPNARVVHIPNATHWVQYDAAEEVNRLLVDFMREDAAI